MEIKITERTAVTRIAGWMNEILREEGIPFESVDSELSISKGEKYPDLVVWKKKNIEIACLIEYKPPNWDVYNYKLIEDAGFKAFKTGAKYFGTWNTNRLALWDAFERDKLLYDRRTAYYEIIDAKKLEDIERKDNELKIKEFLKRFLKDLSKLYIGEKTLTKLPIDEFFIYNLRSVIDAIYVPVAEKIREEYTANKKFKENLVLWCAEQGWTIPSTDEDFERIARQYSYLFVDKILFYNSLRTKFKDLSKIEVSSELDKAEELRNTLQSSFLKAAEKDYKIIFTANFIESLPLPDDVVPNFASFVNGMAKYDFSAIGYDIMGRVFERLIPENERHKLGQYYTRSDVVDIINCFCIRDAKDSVLDTSCGAGTFLVRAYKRKKHLNPKLTHAEILDSLYGIDVSKFAAHLSMINLANMDLSSVEVHPKIIHSDFFEVFPATQISRSKHKSKTMKGETSLITIEKVDAVVGNPPYTRQEEMEDIVHGAYKDKLIKIVEKEQGIEIGRRAGIYAYFFLHGYAFLKNGGRFGFITSNSWLDVDYGKYLQEFFLKNYRIVAVLESKVERWFEDADINTSITILERCSDKKERENNLVKFVYFKKNLKELLKVDDESRRWLDIKNLIKQVENTDDLYEDENLRIYPISQEQLWEEGYDDDERKYAGSKWGKYIRAPDIFFKVLKKGKDLFVPLKEIAQIRFGIKTGANEFFYLTDEDIKRWGIEKEFVKNRVIKSPKESDCIIIDPKKLKYRVLMVHKDKADLKGTNVLQYIKWGEEQGYHKRPTCASRQRWYDLGKRNPTQILWQMIHFEKNIIFLNESEVQVDHNLFDIIPVSKYDNKLLCILLNSTLLSLIKEFSGRVTLGEGALKTEGIDIKKIISVNPSKLSKSQIKKLEKIFDKLSKRPIGTVFEEIGANTPEEVSLGKVKPDRRELDEIVMGDILGLTEKEQVEVYKAVIDLVKSRAEKAKSVNNKKEKKQSDIDVLANHIIEEIDKPKTFPDDYFKKGILFKVIEIPSGQPELGTDLEGAFVKINEEKLRFEDQDEANYVFYAALNRQTRIRIPTDKETLQSNLKSYAKVFKKMEEKIEELSKAYIPDKKLREKVKDEVWKKIFEVKKDNVT